jgi:hypothetical protein
VWRAGSPQHCKHDQQQALKTQSAAGTLKIISHRDCEKKSAADTAKLISRRHLMLQHYSDNVALHFALSHNALARRRKIIASTVHSSLESLLHPKVISLSKFELLSLLKVIAVDSGHKR